MNCNKRRLPQSTSHDPDLDLCDLPDQWFIVDAKPTSLLKTKDGCVIVYYKRVLTDEALSVLRTHLDSLDDKKDWHTGMSCFGHMVPRLIRWHASSSAPYRFAGKDWPALPYPLALALLQAHLQAFVREHIDSSASFASCLVNKYRDGNDSIAKHADNEPEFGPNPSIASLSLGTARTFFLQQKDKDKKTISFELGNGSLLYMGGKTQQNYVHWIAKQPDRKGVRYNMTFRPHFSASLESTRKPEKQ